MTEQEIGKVGVFVPRARFVLQSGLRNHRVELLVGSVVLVTETKLGAVGLVKDLVVVIAHAGHVMQHLPDRNLVTIVGQIGQVFVHIRIEIDIATFGQDCHRHCRELLADGSGAKYRLRGNREVVLQVGEAVARLVDVGAFVNNAGRAARLVLANTREDFIDRTTELGVRHRDRRQ